MIRGLGRDADDARAVVGGGDGARHVRAVPVGVDRARVVVDPVVAGQHARREVGVADVDAGVHDRHGRARAARDRPRLGRVDVGVDRAAAAPDALPRVVETPEQARERIARRLPAHVDLRPAHVGIGAQLGERSPALAVGGDDDLDARDRQRRLQRDAGVRADVRAFRGGQAGGALEDDPLRGVVVRRPGGRRKDQRGEQDAEEDLERARHERAMNPFPACSARIVGGVPELWTDVESDGVRGAARWRRAQPRGGSRRMNQTVTPSTTASATTR